MPAWLLVLSGVTFSILTIAGRDAVAAETVLIENALIQLVDEVEVPALEAGALVEILIREGDTVEPGQVIARLDNQPQKIQADRAKLELAVSRRELANQTASALAAKGVELARQAAIEQDLARKIAHQKAENPHQVEAADKQMEVARNELDRALQARKEFKGSISESEIDGRRLTFEHAELTARQTRFEQAIESLLAEAEDLIARTRTLTIEQARLQEEDAAAKQEVAALHVQLKENLVVAATEALSRREIRSPIGGTVVQVHRHLGEWIEPGESSVRIVRLDRLRVAGFVSDRYATRLTPGAKALVTVQTSDSRPSECEGTISFVSPEVDPVNREVRLWVDLENPENRFRPGMHGTLTIEITQP